MISENKWSGSEVLQYSENIFKSLLITITFNLTSIEDFNKGL